VAVFFWSLEWSGVAIAVVGVARERWLRGRRR